MQDDNQALDTQAPTATDDSTNAYGPSDPMTSSMPGADAPSMPTDDSMQMPSSPSMPTDSYSSSPAPSGGGLQDIKSQALKQLEPLLDHLDQSPEEKFKAIMMMIQAQDNKDLIQSAYEAAQQITDEKVKAQALLDIISEVNYFTANPS